jgi:hypothetical protein
MLNEKLEIEELPVSWLRGLGRCPARVQLWQGTELYKFTENAALGLPRFGSKETISSAGAGFSPWWAFVEPHFHSERLSDPGLQGHLRLARESGLTTLGYARRKFAVMFEWNGLCDETGTLARVQHIRLLVDAWAFIGPGAPMPAFKSRASSDDSPQERARFQNWKSNLTRKQKDESDAMWEQVARNRVGTLGLEGGAMQVCIPNLDSANAQATGVRLIP